MTSQVVLETMQWSSLSSIDEVALINEGDHACLDELRSVLAKHKAGDRFGLHLIHKHFELSDDEILVEYTDEDERTLTCRVEKRADALASGKVIETQWRLNAGAASMVCHSYCNWDHGHSQRHQRKS